MKLIKLTDDRYVVVDDSEIKEGDYCLMFDDYGNLFLGNQPQKYLGERAGHHLNKGLRKITHSTQPLASMKELMEKGYDNILPLDIDEVKELIGETDKVVYHNMTLEQMSHSGHHDFVKGYNQSLEDNREKKYTEEDLVKAYEYGSNALLGISKINLIQSLQPKTEWKYVGECKGNNGNGCFMDSPGHDCGCYKRVPKTGWEVQLVDGKLKLK